VARLAGIAGLLVLVSGCDQGSQRDEPHVGAASIHLLDANVMHAPIAPTGAIELAFDRLLAPGRVFRQSFVLTDVDGNVVSPPPTIAYDPVARVVTIQPSAPLDGSQTYRIWLESPRSDGDANGLRAIDGATLDSATPASIEFTVAPAGSVAASAGGGPTTSFCTDILPVLTTRCGSSVCHGGTPLPASAEGLRLDSPAAVAATAVGRVSEESNTGPRAAPASPTLPFGVDMPIIDPGPSTSGPGDPADSWMIYKLLMAVPSSCAGGPADGGAGPAAATPPVAGADASAAADAGVDAAPAADAGAAVDAGASTPASAKPTDVSGLHHVAWQPLSQAERDILSSLVPGREMPFPADPTAPLDQPGAQLGCDDLERFSLWIAQGAVVPSTCP
jgi:hypothetical protein